MFYVYAIESNCSGRVYIGQTNDIEKRLSFHNSGYVKSTCKDIPWRLIAFERFDTRDKARWCETKLKRSRGTRIKWIEKYLL